MTSAPKKPLQDVLVVAFEQAVAAPYCTSRLADAGARVIKIERPEGDFARGYDAAVGGLSSYFVWLNRGKQSLVADIKNPDDAALLHRIIARADVVVQNLAPGAAARAGFGSAALREKHPRLITVDISGYGAGNAYTDMKAYDLLVQAESGLAGITGHPAGPGRVGVSVCDIACGMAAHAAVLEALIGRGQTGRGSAIETDLFAGMADWMNVPLLYFEGTGQAPARMGLAHPSICPYGAFATSDGSQVLISIQNEREWRNFCRVVMSEPELPEHPHYTSNNARVANRAEVDGHVGSVFATMTRDQAAAKLREAGTAYGFVNSVAELAHHPALRRVGIDTPHGAASIIAPPALRDGVLPALGRVPDIGEHSADIRAEFADRKVPAE
ncbi:putative carnitine dehydratase/acyl-CoA transferases-related (COG1804) [Bradyrhizobium sp. ORS 278]|uniref:CaiB/BaiF CoA transferase family protein n=1 Tax=Bradyrhizobium sp. (strain ORS 278) TaxID=114615 RepID=UPI00015086B9|nr:CaiB/BaiF CoA-transferase family protein [Bradyrhizobium sp. ORS 278]CAL78536.1 putative carnitine dehydratase/acyl-CoA transferases-related (COG1804) [Bradyrhizobium sp. ORS 278]